MCGHESNVKQFWPERRASKIASIGWTTSRASYFLTAPLFHSILGKLYYGEDSAAFIQ